MVRPGASIWPAGIVADSKPSIAQSVSAAAAVTADQLNSTGGTGGASALPPPAMTKVSTIAAASGSSLRMVVASWTAPVPLTLRQLVRVSAQTIAIAARPGTPARPGRKWLR